MKKQYLDYAGLKRVLKRLLPGARKIWHGTADEWEALSETERDKYDQAEVIDADPSEVPMQYTTEEQYTGKKWINGKKIYRKCGFAAGPVTPGNSYTLDSTLTSSYIDSIITVGGSVHDPVGQLLTIGGYSGSDYRSVIISNVSGLLLADSAVTHRNINWLIEYTKTTD